MNKIAVHAQSECHDTQQDLQYQTIAADYMRIEGLLRQSQGTISPTAPSARILQLLESILARSLHHSCSTMLQERPA